MRILCSPKACRQPLHNEGSTLQAALCKLLSQSVIEDLTSSGGGVRPFEEHVDLLAGHANPAHKLNFAGPACHVKSSYSLWREDLGALR
jgi:hypothetical protein